MSGARESLRINFVLPPSATISGGPLAILEYAKRFSALGHSVSITTLPDCYWAGDNPFPWFEFKGPIHYKTLRNVAAKSMEAVSPTDLKALSKAILAAHGPSGLMEVLMQSAPAVADRSPFEFLLRELTTWMHTIESMPDCDLNIATWWSTAFAVYYSRKGRPVYFMQHNEELFYPLQPDTVLQRLLVRMTYGLPLNKVANSSWLQQFMAKVYRQDIPYSTNGLALEDFTPAAKTSERDSIIRVVTYASPQEWKGFPDACAAMERVLAKHGARVQWHVFGYRYPALTESNSHAPYVYHPKLSFAELGRLYATSDIALCPSWYESFPLPPLEAMASGTAVVTTRLGTEDYAFNEQNALVVAPRDIEAMSAAVMRLIEDEGLRARLAAAGRQTAGNFAWDRAVAEREKILLAIHRGATGYDVAESARPSLADVARVEAGASIAGGKGETGLFWQDDKLYLLQNGVKRHVVNQEVVNDLLDREIAYLEVDDLTIARSPLGMPVSSVADLAY